MRPIVGGSTKIRRRAGGAGQNARFVTEGPGL
jgi:hypothetical protein